MSLFSIISPFERLLPIQTDIAHNALVYKIRLAVAAWRNDGYKGISKTSLGLLNFWFNIEHTVDNKAFRFYFSQREAIESIIFLYEVAKAHEKAELLKFASSDHINLDTFTENWTQYVLKLSAASDRMKVLGLTIVWSYFNKLYEGSNLLSKNFLVVAPNIITLERLIKEIDGLKMFFSEPLLPDNGFDDKEWRFDFQPTLHILNDINPIYEFGNIFLTDVNNFMYNFDYHKSNSLKLFETLHHENIKDLVVLNAGFSENFEGSPKYVRKNRKLNDHLKQNNGIGISLQLDYTSTTYHYKSQKFLPTICNFSLAEAIKYNLVKSPVLPDENTRKKLSEKESDSFIERYRDFMELGYSEWEKQYAALKSLKTPILYIITLSIEEALEAKKFLETNYPEMHNAVLTIQANNSSDIFNNNANQERDELRDAAIQMFKNDSKYKAVISTFNLCEGWNLPNVTTIVGLLQSNNRFYNPIKESTLPEQILGTGLDKIFSSEIPEKLVLIGTEIFLESIESLLTSEGIDIQYSQMGEGSNAISPQIIEVDTHNSAKNLTALDIKLPVLSQRICREFENLALIDECTFKNEKAPLKIFNINELEEIIFSSSSFKAVPKTIFLNAAPDYRNIISFLTIDILTECQLERGFAILYPKVENFIKKYLFNAEIEIAKAQTMRNLAEPQAREILKASFKKAIDETTVIDKGFAEIKNFIPLIDTKLQVVESKKSIQAQKSVFNKINCDSDFEYDLVSKFENTFLDVISFAKNTKGEGGVNFKIEYQTLDGNISEFYPHFFVKTKPNKIFIIETKASEAIEDIRKIKRLATWCIDANVAQTDCVYTPLYIQQEKWNNIIDELKTFEDVCARFRAHIEDNLYLQSQTMFS